MLTVCFHHLQPVANWSQANHQMVITNHQSITNHCPPDLLDLVSMPPEAFAVTGSVKLTMNLVAGVWSQMVTSHSVTEALETVFTFENTEIQKHQPM